MMKIKRSKSKTISTIFSYHTNNIQNKCRTKCNERLVLIQNETHTTVFEKYFVDVYSADNLRNYSHILSAKNFNSSH